MFNNKEVRKRALKIFAVLMLLAMVLILSVGSLMIFQARSTHLESNSSMEYFDIVLKKERISQHFRELISTTLQLSEMFSVNGSDEKALANALPWIEQHNEILALKTKKGFKSKVIIGADYPGLQQDVSQIKVEKLPYIQINLKKIGNIVESIRIDFVSGDASVAQVSVYFSGRKFNDLLDSIFVGNLGQTLLFFKNQQIETIGSVGEDHKILLSEIDKDGFFAQFNGSQDSLASGIVTSDMVLPLPSDRVERSDHIVAEIAGVDYNITFNQMVLVSLLPNIVLYQGISDFVTYVLFAGLITFALLFLAIGVYVIARFRHEEVEENLKFERRRSLEKARLASIGETAAGIAHEINNPMTVIQMNVEIIKLIIEDRKIDLEQIRKSIDNILQTVSRVSSIVRGLQTLGREASKDPLIEASLSQIIHDALNVAKMKFDESTLEIKIGEIDKSYRVQCRPSQLSQVLINLVTNATQATEQQDDPWVNVDVQRLDEVVEISITDSGPGISELEVEKIFAPFYTTKEVGKGTGLGLSLSKKIVEEHDGQLFIDQKCKNTRFVIQLPFSNDFSQESSEVGS